MSGYVILVLVVGLVRFLVSLRRSGETSRVVLRQRPAADDPRWGPPRDEDQIVGTGCARCDEVFVIAAEARRCKKCGIFVHKKTCFAEHKMAEHHTTTAPYR